MRAKKRAIRRPAAAPSAPAKPEPRFAGKGGIGQAPVTAEAPVTRFWLATGLFLTLYAALQAYAPVLHGPFLFDDNYLPFRSPNQTTDLGAWLGVIRPLLMFSYWVNFRLFGIETFSYHLFNVFFHAGSSFLLFFIVRQILKLASVESARRDILAAFAAGVFLLHPIQTESVAYVASRSENLSVLFFFAAFAVFLYRRTAAIGWPAAAAVLLLFAAALASKEHTLVLPALLLATDYYWNPGFSFAGARRNWRLYVPLALGGAAGLVFIRSILFQADSAGFGLKDFTWYQYFFTECRAFFVYLRLFLLPVGQTVDYDFAISRTVLEHGAIFGLLAILLLASAALYFRRRYALASYGLVVFLLLLAPTSSFVPIKDPIAERRLYLPMIGLLLIGIEFLRRIRAERKTLILALASLVLLLGILTYQRNQVWTGAITLWQDTVQKSPRNPRAHFQLAHAYFQDGRCDQAVSEYAEVEKLEPPAKYDLLVDWALAYDCLGQSDQALAKLRQAARLERRAHVYSQIGMVYAKAAKWPEALEALAAAEKLDPGYAMTYVYRGGVHTLTNQYAAAVADYRRALDLDPNNQPAREGLAAVEARFRRAP